MKRFLVFTGELYYPLGGMKDFKSDFDTLEEAKDYLLSPASGYYDWAQIYDIKENKLVYEAN
jgi:hypothetical protein